MRKAVDRIINAIKTRTHFVQRGQNAVTGQRGDMYGVNYDEKLDMISVWYWKTCVVNIHPSKGIITLRTGGFHTKTTKQTINAALTGIGLNWSVYQRNFEWYIDIDGKEILFEENKPYACGELLARAS